MRLPNSASAEQEAAAQDVCQDEELQLGPSELSATSYHSAHSNFATVEDLRISLSPNSMRHSNSAGSSEPQS